MLLLMELLIINSAPNTEEFVGPIIKTLAHTGIRTKLVPCDTIPGNLDRYCGLIISASPRGDDIVYDHLPYFQWIRNFTKPALGICHGHQVIGVLHGAKLIRDKQGEEGECVVNLEEPDPLFAGYEKSFKAEQHHKDSITLPDEFKLIASSARCRVQSMVHRTKSMYTVQFHAENDPKIILNFTEIIKQGKFKPA